MHNLATDPDPRKRFFASHQCFFFVHIRRAKNFACLRVIYLSTIASGDGSPDPRRAVFLPFGANRLRDSGESNGPVTRRAVPIGRRGGGVGPWDSPRIAGGDRPR
jgi:hypothetical protein